MTAAFARITDLHDQLACLINPCARLLYRWLLRRRPAGKIQEFNLSDFQNWSAQRRRRPYCTRQIRRALTQLIDQGLVGQVKKYYSLHCWRLAAYHPDETKMPDPSTKPSDSDTKKSKTQPSNLHSAVPSYREKHKEIADTHPPHPAAVLKKNCFEEKTEISQEVEGSQTPISESNQQDVEFEEEVELVPNMEDAIEPQIPAHEQKLNQIDDCGIRLNAQLEALVRDFTLAEVKHAIAYYRQTKRTKESKGQKIDRPAGWLTNCLRERWWKTAEPEKTREQEEFETWYANAIASGLVEDVPISWLTQHNQTSQLLVRQRKPGLFGAPYTLVPWRELHKATTESAVTTEESDNDSFNTPY